MEPPTVLQSGFIALCPQSIVRNEWFNKVKIAEEIYGKTLNNIRQENVPHVSGNSCYHT